MVGDLSSLALEGLEHLDSDLVLEAGTKILESIKGMDSKTLKLLLIAGVTVLAVKEMSRV